MSVCLARQLCIGAGRTCSLKRFPPWQSCSSSPRSLQHRSALVVVVEAGGEGWKRLRRGAAAVWCLRVAVRVVQFPAVLPQRHHWSPAHRAVGQLRGRVARMARVLVDL
jgi:hypothetical protein